LNNTANNQAVKGMLLCFMVMLRVFNALCGHLPDVLNGKGNAPFQPA